MPRRAELEIRTNVQIRRDFSVSQTRREDRTRPVDNTPTSFEKSSEEGVHTPTAESAPPPPSDNRPSTSQTSSKPTPLPDSASLTNQQKSNQRLSELTTHLLETASALSNRLNSYTGTDYTPIAALRATITSQEQQIKNAHDSVASAKQAHAAAQATQSGAQKEVVQLLERKHSWTNGDLERYMALIRSEHENEQGVAGAARGVAEAERALEGARQALEKMERRMYHEEQLWSDNIRRNSTWVTFGLMGVNLVLLLANVVVVEPWRRRRMVREIRGALEEKAAAVAPAASESATLASRGAGHVAAATTAQVRQPQVRDGDSESDMPALAASSMEVEADTAPGGSADQSLTPSPATMERDQTWQRRLEDWRTWSLAVPEQARDLLSDRALTLRMFDATTLAVQSAVVGAASTLVILWAAGTSFRGGS